MVGDIEGALCFLKYSSTVMNTGVISCCSACLPSVSVKLAVISKRKDYVHLELLFVYPQADNQILNWLFSFQPLSYSLGDSSFTFLVGRQEAGK